MTQAIATTEKIQSMALTQQDNTKSLIAIRSDRRMYPHYGDIKNNAGRLKWIKNEITKCYTRKHQVPEEQFLTLDGSDLDYAIMADNELKELTGQEIQAAFLNGVQGKYGDYFGLTVETFLGWLRSFALDNREVYLKLQRERYKAKIEREQQENLDRLREKFAKELAEAAKQKTI